ncbi:MAG: glycoside hydrolase family 25 protein [Rhizobiaceae bacterium]|nr:glycoside hydrolase family 25 protein [Rhizobiaceae bacterium]
MRSIRISLPLLASLWLAGCMSNAGIDSLQVGATSPDASSSAGLAPIPPAAVGMADGAGDDRSAFQSATADYAEPDIQPVALVTPDSVADLAAAPRAVAMIAPAKPSPRLERRVARSFEGAVQRHRFRDAKPINFGASSPRDLPVHGVDVSRWQGEIDWVKLRSQGANFVYIKATDGGDHLDPMFRRNWREADAAGLRRGAYHFFYWCRTAGEQADWFIRNVPRVEGALPPVIDVEYNGESKCKRRLSPTKIREKMQVFMDRLEAHYGQRPVIYTAPDFYRDNLKGAFLDYPFWLRAVAQHPSKVYPGRKWVFWQYSGSGLSHGVTGKIDLNVFNGSEKAWRRWASGQSYVARAD